jgi:hypothetical protein
MKGPALELRDPDEGTKASPEEIILRISQNISECFLEHTPPWEQQ